MSKIKEPEARAAFLALGSNRSLPELYRRYTESDPKTAPSMATFKSWSRKYGWQRIAREHDERVGQQAAGKVAEKQARRAADLVGHLISAAHKGLTRAVKIAGKEVKFKDLVDGSVTALKAAEVLAGGVSDRIEQHQRVHLERAQAVRRELENLFGPSDQPPQKPNGRDPLVH